MVPYKRCLDMTDRRTYGQTDRRTDMAKSIFLVALIKNVYILYGLTCLLPPVTYILPKLICPFFSFLEKAGLKIELIIIRFVEIKI